ncbi:hypothetical protein BpHYR1_036229 [Brachionus plicatilis]|uniref:Uncharacterized protein n=1 Tax=Brachionus plicatilis TaxID=10195 RepID=A0A3M7S3S4_BRAPC|nr:hypothetical protein BpHYR1_036229 [Brachionus plicatilis]
MGLSILVTDLVAIVTIKKSELFKSHKSSQNYDLFRLFFMTLVQILNLYWITKMLWRRASFILNI